MSVRRRDCLAALSGISLTAIAGCTGSIPLIGDDDPEDVFDAYIQAIQDDDREAANELIHPDAPSGEISESEWENLQELDSIEGEVTSVEEDGDEAVAETEVTVEYDGEETTDEGELEFRTHDDEWRIWN